MQAALQPACHHLEGYYTGHQGRVRGGGGTGGRVGGGRYGREGLVIHTPGGAQTRQCTQKVVSGPCRSLVSLRGGAGAATVLSEASRLSSAASQRVPGLGGVWGGYGREGLVIHTPGGAQTRQCTQKVVSGPCRSLVSLRGGAGAATVLSEASRLSSAASQRVPGLGGVWGGYGREGLAVHTQGGANTRQSVATTRVLLCKGGAGAGPPSSEASRLSRVGSRRVPGGGV